jgi:hypothetical protein
VALHRSTLFFRPFLHKESSMKNWKQLLGVGAMLLTALAWSPAAQA